VRFVYAVRGVRASSFAIRQLDYLIRHHFNPTSSFVPDDSALAQTLMDLRTRLLNVESGSDEDKLTLQKEAVNDRIASELDLSADVTGLLLAKVSHSAKTALERFVELTSINDDQLSRTVAPKQFETLEKLHKVATIFHVLDLPDGGIDWLLLENPWLTVAPDPPAGSRPDPTAW
jgi:hypothetical protein